MSGNATARIDRPSLSPAMIAIICASAVVGATAVLYGRVILIAFVSALLFVVFRWLICRRMRFWQGLMLISLTGFIIFNYGFENLVLGRVAGIPVLIGHVLMFWGLSLAAFSCPRSTIRDFFAQPAVKCFALLVAISMIHLAIEVPRSGLWALRDASLFIESVFLLAGFAWIREPGSLPLIKRWLVVLFVLNLLYSCTLPLGETLQDVSPKTGVFQPVPLLGNYQHNALYLVAGALFFIWFGPELGIRRWMAVCLSIAQLAALAIMQTRSMYVGFVIVVLLLLVVGERRKLSSIAGLIPGTAIAVALLMFFVSSSGVQVRGRVFDLSSDSLEQYAGSIFALTDRNSRLGQDEDRMDWLQQTWDGTTSTAARTLFGQGFGEPLLKDVVNDNGMPVRQPHNSTAGVFGRVGLNGIIPWLLFHVCMIGRFVSAQRGRLHLSLEQRDLMLWLFAFYVLALVLSMVQPAFEFSHCAIPVFFLLGMALGIAPETSPASDALLSFQE